MRLLWLYYWILIERQEKIKKTLGLSLFRWVSYWKQFQRTTGTTNPVTSRSVPGGQNSQAPSPWENKIAQIYLHLIVGLKIYVITNIWQSLLLWDVTRSRLVVIYRRFRTTCLSLRLKYFVDCLTLKMGPIDWPETSINHYQSAPRNDPEERSCHLYGGENHKSRTCLKCIQFS